MREKVAEKLVKKSINKKKGEEEVGEKSRWCKNKQTKAKVVGKWMENGRKSDREIGKTE